MRFRRVNAPLGDTMPDMSRVNVTPLLVALLIISLSPSGVLAESSAPPPDEPVTAEPVVNTAEPVNVAEANDEARSPESNNATVPSGKRIASDGGCSAIPNPNGGAPFALLIAAMLLFRRKLTTA